MVGVDQDRQATARPRRLKIISSLNEGFDLNDHNSPLGKFRDLLDRDHIIVTNADIDGVLSAQMLSAQTGWRVGALVDRSGAILIEPTLGTASELLANHSVFGVDLFSTAFPSVSNHPVLFGAARMRNVAIRGSLERFDQSVESALFDMGSLNLSGWVGIGAMQGSTSPTGMPYKYPLGTAQVLLAALEVVGLAPRLYDRQYLPWLIANCDGGVETIRSYAWNVETWWSALAAVAGPATHSEEIYRLVTEQRPNQFLDMDRRLRYDEPDRSRFLTSKWNLTSTSPEAIDNVVNLIADLSGWGDPFLGGSANLDDWSAELPTRGVMRVEGITKLSDREREAHLRGALSAINMNFSVFKERGTALGWALPNVDEDLAQQVDSPPDVEVILEESPSILDAVE